jgi:hypothetical protein
MGTRKLLAVPISNDSVEEGERKLVDEEGDGSVSEPKKVKSPAR